MKQNIAVPKPENNIGANALLIDNDGKLILQKRDNKPDIFYPGYVTMFGGTIKKDETPLHGLLRELSEELNFDFSLLEAKKYLEYQKTLDDDGIDYLVNVYIIEGVNFKELQLSEGQAIVHEYPEAIYKNEKLTKLMRFVLDQYIDS